MEGFKEGDRVEWAGEDWTVVTVWAYEKKLELERIGAKGDKKWAVVEAWETKLKEERQ